MRYIQPVGSSTQATFVALDVEATGFDPDASEVIEIAVAVFNRSGIVDQFESLVRPRRRVPLEIEQLTGITNTELQASPRLDELLPRVRELIGPHAIVGHTIRFDVTKLQQAGIPLTNRQIDTYQLSTALLPDLPNYGLATIADHLGIPFPEEERHRAMPDVQATVRLFQHLLDRIDRYDGRTLSDVARYARAAAWPEADLFADAADSDLPFPLFSEQQDQDGYRYPPLELAFLDKRERPEPLKKTGVQTPIDPDAIGQFLSSSGPLADILPNYESRPTQTQMAQAVARAFNDDESLMVEAGTGTGKSLAYLLPSALYALTRGERVVVSTDTLALQDQLYRKDLPDVRTTLAAAGFTDPLRVSVMKGRDNYICLSRWFQHASDPIDDPADASLRAKVLLWLGQTRTGDKSELRLTPEEDAHWRKYSSERGRCSMKRCTYAKNGQCFYYRARANAANAHIVIANHALVLTNLEGGGFVIPSFDRLVIDEAHHLEEEATDQFGFSLTRETLDEAVAMLVRAEAGSVPGLFTQAMQYLTRSTVAQAIENAPQAMSRVTEATKIAETARRQGQELYTRVTRLLPTSRGRGGYAEQLRITEQVRVQSSWMDCLMAWEQLDYALRQVLDTGRWFLQVLDDLPLPDERENPETIARDDLVLDLGNQLEILQIHVNQLMAVFDSDTDTHVHWISRSALQQIVSLNGAPLDVSELLQQMVFSRMRSTILTSATMTIDGSFDYMAERLGAESARRLALGSPFDHQASTLLYVADDISEPGQQYAYAKAMNDSLIDLLIASKGRALVLFTSYRALRETRAAIKEPLEAHNIVVLAQGSDGSSRQLIDRLRASPGTVILGTSSFWEGVDIVGDALSLVVITKLPFPVPSDPVFEARSEHYLEPFMELSLPMAVLKFKQGFGRLIRSSSDIGACVVFDRRVISKRYGSSFIQSLPPCRVAVGPVYEIPEAVGTWLDRAKRPRPRLAQGAHR